METSDPHRLGELVRRHRTAAAFSQEELAERTGLSVRGISDLERGVHRAPRLETVRMVADALELDEAERVNLIAAARPLVLDTEDPARGRPLRPAALPIPPTRLVGRERDVAELLDLLAQDDVRLVTLTGPGGTGKTRLALAVAEKAAPRYHDGVWFVDLSALTDASLVVPTIATVIGVSEVAGETAPESVIRYLRDRRLMLVLDNCEQVLEAAPEIAALLAVCPGVAILATSREPLHVRAEREVAVEPLPLPEAGRLPPLAELAHVAAVALFIERARAANARFTLAEENAEAVAAICRRLDGLPLAIELAAARVKVLPPQALLTRLEQRLPVLIGGGRDMPARQQTMRAAIAWSHDLLHAENQEVFRRLSVFAGGCTLEAAEAVASEDGMRDILPSLAALVDISLLRQAEDRPGEPRFRMLETVREFGQEQLALAGETDDARRRHAAHFLRRANSVTESAPRVVNLERMTAFAADLDNLRLALDWFDKREETDAMLQVCIALYGLWTTRGPHREGIQWLERVLERTDRTASRPRVATLSDAGRLATLHGEYHQAASFVAEGLALARELGDPFSTAQALNNAGFLSYRQGDYQRAEDQLREAQQLWRDLDNDIPEVGIDEYLPDLLLGDAALAQGQFPRAERQYERAHEIAQKLGAVWGEIDARVGLAGASLCNGDVARAVALYAECLSQARDLGVRMLVASSLLGVGGVAAVSGQAEVGARLLGAAEGLAASVGAPLFPRDRPIHELCLAALTGALPADRLAAEREAGSALSVDQAVAEAQAVAEGIG